MASHQNGSEQTRCNADGFNGTVSICGRQSTLALRCLRRSVADAERVGRWSESVLSLVLGNRGSRLGDLFDKLHHRAAGKRQVTMP